MYPAPKNPAYKTWLEEAKMPWQVAPARRYCEIRNGGTPSSQVPEYWDGDVMWLTPDDLGKADSRYIDFSQRTITRSLSPQLCWGD